MIKKIMTTTALCATIIGSAVSAEGETMKPIEKRVLWIGSSSTGYHEMPRQFAEMINNSNLGFTINYDGNIDRITIGGTPVCHIIHIEDGKIVDHKVNKPEKCSPRCEKAYKKGYEKGKYKGEGIDYHTRIIEGNYDFIVLQLLPRDLHEEGERERFIQLYKNFAPIAKKVDAKTIIYPTLKLSDIPENLKKKLKEVIAKKDMNDGLKYRTTKSLKHKIIEHKLSIETSLQAYEQSETYLAPCDRIWERVRRERSDIELQNHPLGKSGDGHPGVYGMTLNMLSLYTAMTGENPNKLNLKSFTRYSIGAKEKKDRGIKNNKEIVTFKPEMMDYFKKVVWEEYLKIKNLKKESKND